jgi:hypothetical protein
MAIESFGEIISYMDTNKENDEVKTYLDSFKVQVQPTLEVFKGKLNDPDFKSFMDSVMDKHSTKSLETWKANNLDNLVSARVKELYPEADPKDIALNKLQAQLDKMQSDSERKDLTNKTLKQFQDAKLPSELVDFMVGADAEETNKNVEALIKLFAAHDEQIRTEFVKSNSYTPPNGDKTNLSAEEKTRAEISKWMK